MSMSGTGVGMGMGIPNRPMANSQNNFTSGMGHNNSTTGLGAGNSPYPMMGPPMRMGHGVMNPTLLQSQMQIGMSGAGMMGPQGAVMGMQGMGGGAMSNMMMHTPGMTMGMMPQMMGGMGPVGTMGMNMGGFSGDSVYPQAGGFQNGFVGQPGFGGPQMNMGWGPY